MFFSFSFVSWGQIFGVFFAPFPEEEISDYIAHGPIIRVLTVSEQRPVGFPNRSIYHDFVISSFVFILVFLLYILLLSLSDNILISIDSSISGCGIGVGEKNLHRLRCTIIRLL